MHQKTMTSTAITTDTLADSRAAALLPAPSSLATLQPCRPCQLRLHRESCCQPLSIKLAAWKSSPHESTFPGRRAAPGGAGYAEAAWQHEGQASRVLQRTHALVRLLRGRSAPLAAPSLAGVSACNYLHAPCVAPAARKQQLVKKEQESSTW